MPLPSFKSPPFLLSNYEYFGEDLILNTSTGIISDGGNTSPTSHSAVSFPFIIYDARITNNLSRSGAILDADTGFFNSYSEFAYFPGIDYNNPSDYIRLNVQVEKRNVGPVSPSNPLYTTITVRTGQLGIVYTHPTYEVTTQASVPNAAIRITVNENEGIGQADVDVEWNDIVNLEYFSHRINNYPFNLAASTQWRYHTRLNIEAYPNINVLEDYQELIVASNLVAGGIPSEEAFGTPLLELAQPQIISPSGIISGEIFGALSISVGRKDIVIQGGISSQEAFGLHDIKNTTVVRPAVEEPIVPTEGDIELTITPGHRAFQITLGDRDVIRDPSFETAILVSLLSNRKANSDDELPSEEEHRGGWVGDTIYSPDNFVIGSRLWLLRRTTITQETINKAEEYILEALKWMLDDEIAETITAEVYKAPNKLNTLVFIIKIKKPDVSSTYYKYFYNWEGQIERI